MNIDFGRAVLAGIIGTAVMTAVGLWVAPMMGMPPMNPATMLAGAMGGSVLLGWLGHFMIGIILTMGFAAIGGHLPGSPVAKGMIYSLAPWLMAQVMVMPMMGMPLFSGSASMAIGSLIGHLVFGGVIGAVYGAPSPARARSTA